MFLKSSTERQIYAVETYQVDPRRRLFGGRKSQSRHLAESGWEFSIRLLCKIERRLLKYTGQTSKIQMKPLRSLQLRLCATTLCPVQRNTSNKTASILDRNGKLSSGYLDRSANQRVTSWIILNQKHSLFFLKNKNEFRFSMNASRHLRKVWHVCKSVCFVYSS